MSVFGFFVFECFDHLSDLLYPSSNDTVLLFDSSTVLIYNAEAELTTCCNGTHATELLVWSQPWLDWNAAVTNKNKQSSSNKAAEKMYMLQSIDAPKKRKNPIKTRNFRGQLLFCKMLDSPAAADNRGQQGLSIDTILRSKSIRGHPRTTK